MKTYFKDVIEISMEDWNNTYMDAFDDDIWEDRTDLDCFGIDPDNAIFNSIVEDTDGCKYRLTALLPDTGPIVVKVTHWEEE